MPIIEFWPGTLVDKRLPDPRPRPWTRKETREQNGYRPFLCWVLPHRFCRWTDPADCPVHRPRQFTRDCAMGNFKGCYVCQPDGRSGRSHGGDIYGAGRAIRDLMELEK